MAMPTDVLVQQVANFPDEYPFSEETIVVIHCMPLMAFNPAYVAPGSTCPPVEPEISPFWTDPACTDTPPYAVKGSDDHIAGIISPTPGRLGDYMIGHLKTLQSPINCSYFEEIPYVKVQAFWRTLLHPAQVQHGLASVSENELSQDAWVRVQDPNHIPPELLKDFDHSLLEPADLIPDGSASCVAFMNYTLRTLQIVLCESKSNVFKHQLMWDARFSSWRLVFAFLPASRAAPPTFFNITWKQIQSGRACARTSLTSRLCTSSFTGLI